MGCIAEGKCSASDHTTRHRAENPAQPPTEPSLHWGRIDCQGGSLGKKKKQGEPRTKWHTEHFGNPRVSVIPAHAVHKEVVPWRMRWWTYYCLQGQTWNCSPRQIPGSTHWLKSCFQGFYSLLMQRTHHWSNLQIYIYLKKGKKWLTDIACLLFQA